MTLKLLKTQEKRREVKENRKMDLNWIRKSFGQYFWFYLLMHCVTYFAIVYALFVPSFFSFLLSLSHFLSIYLLSIIMMMHMQFLCCIIMLLRMIDNVFRSNLLRITAYQMVENRTDLKCLMSLWVFFIPFHFFMFSVSLSLYNLNA